MSLVDTWLEDGVKCENCGLTTIKLVGKMEIKDNIETRNCTCTICSSKWKQRFDNGKWIIHEGW